MKYSALLSFATVTALALCAAAPVGSPAPVVVTVSALASTQATVKLYFYNSADKFLKKNQYALSRFVKPNGQSSVTVPVELPPGEWAVALTQDTNHNDKLDKNFLGIPTEPFAFSNNVRPTLGPPKFEECKFHVSGAGQVLSIALK